MEGGRILGWHGCGSMRTVRPSAIDEHPEESITLGIRF